MTYKLTVVTTHIDVEEEDLARIVSTFKRHGHTAEDMERLQKIGSFTVYDEWWPRGNDLNSKPVKIASTMTLEKLS